MLIYASFPHSAPSLKTVGRLYKLPAYLWRSRTVQLAVHTPSGAKSKTEDFGSISCIRRGIYGTGWRGGLGMDGFDKVLWLYRAIGGQRNGVRGIGGGNFCVLV
jgi:hypothetical protein